MTTSDALDIRVQRLAATDAGIQLQVVTWGDVASPAPGATAVLAIHGVTANARAFDGIAGALAPERPVVAFDLRGRGGSDVPTADPALFGPERHVRDAIHVLDALGLAQVDVIGWSLGAAIGLCLAARHPERVRSLALLDPGLTESSELARASLATVQQRLTRQYSSMDAALEMLRNGPALAGCDADAIAAFLRADLQEDADGSGTVRHVMTLETLTAERESARPALTALVPLIECPVLILRATDPLLTPGDNLLSAEDAARAVTLFRRGNGTASQAQTMDIAGTNHYTIALGIPQGTIAALQGFMAQADVASA